MPELSRSLQPRHITMISIGGMIGAGLFVSSSAAIAATGPAIVLSYLITGTLVLLVMRMLGEMAVALPAVRSFTEFARAGLGPWAGFVAGWLYWYFWMIVVPVEAIAGANILHAWLGLPSWLLGLLLMGIMTAVNLMSARSYGEFEFWFASIKVAAILVFIALAAAYACGFTSPTGPTLRNLSAYDGFMPKGWVAVLAGAVTVYFSLTGAEITTIAAAESKEPARAVAKMSSSVIVRILTFYVGSVLLILSRLPDRDAPRSCGVDRHDLGAVVGVLDAHDGVGALGHRCAGHDPHRLARSDGAVGKRSGGDRAHDAKRHAAARDICSAHRVTVHRRVAEGRYIAIGDRVLREDRAERVEQRDRAGHVEVSGPARQQSGLAHRAERPRKPRLVVEADAHEQRGGLELGEGARLDLHAVRVVERRRQAHDAHARAADDVDTLPETLAA